MIKEELNNLLKEQLSNWELASKNFKSLSQVKTKTLEVEGIRYGVQFNPARITSSAAKVDVKSIQERKCFLCSENRPAVQKGIDFDKYIILLNPFPIFPKHLTIPDRTHTIQKIEGRIGDMLELSKVLDEYVLFYNGPKCGASAPDHMHFQAGNKGFLPIEKDIDTISSELIIEEKGVEVALLNDSPRNTIHMKGGNKDTLTAVFNKLYNTIPTNSDDVEPMLNILAWYTETTWHIVLFLRKKHRPECYYKTGTERLLSSPASVDLGGVFITPIEEDFNKITGAKIENILSEVCLNKREVKNVLKQLNQNL